MIDNNELMPFPDDNPVEFDLQKELKSITKWLQQRRNRNAKPANIRIDFGGLITKPNIIVVNLSNSSDEVMSSMFEASISNKSIWGVSYYYDTISLYVGHDKDNTKPTNIDTTVMETILSWFTK